jgi:uncharacterized protein (DUF433 family)
MSTSPPSHWKYLARDPKSTSYRQLFIKGRRIRATTLYDMSLPSEEGPGMTPEEIAADYDLPVEAVLEAIAYCASDPPEIRRDIEMDEALSEATGMNDPNYKYHPTPKILPPEEMARLMAPFDRE